MKSNHRCDVFVALVIVCSTTVLPFATCDVFGEERVAAQINSPLTQSNLDRILDNRGKVTDSEIIQMLGAPTSIEMGGENVLAGQVRMSWHDVSRIELTFREGTLVAIKGTFSPRLKSQSINYSTFTKLRMGMNLDDVRQQFFLGHAEETTHGRFFLDDGERTGKEPKKGTRRLMYEQYVSFYVYFKDGMAQTASRVEFLNR